jgi:hypothetical protein
LNLPKLIEGAIEHLKLVDPEAVLTKSAVETQIKIISVKERRDGGKPTWYLKAN